MSIVAISQTLGSLGDEIGRALARTLGYELADREIVLQAADRFGEGVRALQHFTDEKPTLWEHFRETRERYLAYVEAIVWELAARDDVVLVGRGGPFLLTPVRHALRVRITAPEGVRARRLETDYAVPLEAVRHSDRERAARVRFLYHLDWDDPLCYDLVLNTEHLPVPDGARIVREALRSERYQPTDAARRDVRDRAATAGARAVLLADPVTRGLFFQLSPTCADGRLSIGGTVDREELRDAVEALLRRVPGVTEVRNEIVLAPSGTRGSHPR